MNTKKTIISAVILVLLLVIYMWDSGRTKIMDEEKFDSKNLSALSSQDLISITITKTDETINLVKDTKSDVWKIKMPGEYTIGVDLSSVTNLLNAISRIENMEEIGNVENRSKYGLQPPVVILEYRTDEKSQKLFIGKKNPADTGVYLQVDDNDEVILAAAAIFDASNKTLYDFRDRDLLKLETGELASLTLVANGKKLKIDQLPDNKWVIDTPEKQRGDQERITSFLSSLKQADVKEFLKEVGKQLKTGLQNPSKKLIFSYSNGTTVEFTIGNDAPDKSAHPTDKPQTANEKYVYVLSSLHREILIVRKNLFKDLKATPARWRSRKILDISFDTINKTHIKGPVEDVSFQRTRQSEYQIIQPSGLKTGSWECNTLNTRIADIKTVKFLTVSPSLLKKAGFNKPYASIIIITGKNDLSPNAEPGTYEIVFGNIIKLEGGKTGRYTMIKGNDREAFLVPVDAIKDLIKTPFELRDKSLVSLQSEHVEKLIVSSKIKTKQVDIIIEKSGDSWEVSEPSEYDKKDVDDLVYNITGLQMDGTAKKPTSLSDYGLEPPFAAVTLISYKGKKIKILIGNLIPGDDSKQNYLMLKNDNNIYIVSDGLRNSIKGLLE